MLILDYAAGAVIRVTTTSTADIEAQVSGVDHTISGDVFLAFQQNTAIAAAQTTTIGTGPATGHVRNYKRLSLRNKHASTANTLTIEHYNGTLAVQVDKQTLQAGEEWVLNDQGTVFVYDAKGGVKMGASAASDTLPGLIQIAVQSDMEAGSSAIVAVTPLRLNFHPATVKFICMTTGTTTPAMQTPPSWNMTSITDTGVGRLTVTIATDFSTANWCVQISWMGISTTLTAIALVQTGYVRLSTMAAGTIEINLRDATATTNALADGAGYYVCGFGDQA